MQIGHIPGATRILGKSQGFFGLPVRDEVIEERATGSSPCMTTAWLPDPAELERIAAGAAIHVRILGTAHPPILVEVGDVPSEEVG